MTYTYYGCYNNPYYLIDASSALPVPAGLQTLDACKEQAISNNSSVYGLTGPISAIRNDGDLQAQCYLSYSAPIQIPAQQFMRAIQYGAYDGSGTDITNYPICNGDEQIGSLDGPEISTSVFVNDQAISFFDDATIKKIEGNIAQEVSAYQLQLNALNSRFNQIVNDISNALTNLIPSTSSTIPEQDSTIIDSNFNELSLVIKQFQTLQLNLRLTCNKYNNDIIALNQGIHGLDYKNYLAQNKITRLYGTDNAAIGLLGDDKALSSIKITENIMFIVSIIIFASVVAHLES
jgi:hypothetical protein